MKIVKKIISKKNLDERGKMLKAHRVANRIEKKYSDKFNPGGYNRLKKTAKKLGKNQYMGRNYYDGKTEVSKIVPKKDVPEVNVHERVELKEKQMMKHKLTLSQRKKEMKKFAAAILKRR